MQPGRCSPARSQLQRVSACSCFSLIGPVATEIVATAHVWQEGNDDGDRATATKWPDVGTMTRLRTEKHRRRSRRGRLGSTPRGGILHLLTKSWLRMRSGYGAHRDRAIVASHSNAKRAHEAAPSRRTQKHVSARAVLLVRLSPAFISAVIALLIGLGWIGWQVVLDTAGHNIPDPEEAIVWNSREVTALDRIVQAHIQHIARQMASTRNDKSTEKRN